MEKNASDVAQYSHALCKHIDIIGGMNKNQTRRSLSVKLLPLLPNKEKNNVA
ncbi:hypothetical protein [Corynebacterium diphtheriae]|uniref:hypothetical protein n=1 Tax=Corynebacterium diphtheriae TaxID=1717 RepID=UPI000A8D6CFE|nr:hypothetical protein [Corynebacterium diphtheriae]CAB0588874.1 hypothetical protein CIP107552_00670 [Corynebacterium diphtheriae]CAB0588926.1 hypothetical protein CIP107559_00651 [Corynebacterium diphtheriae]CAB0592113.1 hypothetical protein CIP107557_00654 [Corynebacterium diphtheriae]CAB0592161.1 hypothetical protein CIP107544_00654 [Corynebacterium diphtheriae]CAB0681124.1 hypothetical protein FRC0069_00475 [Corynebacterium diphtheriae]